MKSEGPREKYKEVSVKIWEAWQAAFSVEEKSRLEE
jgi:hypothetical protein